MAKTRVSNSSKDATYQCTGCSKSIKTTFDAHLHPLINCLICRNCYVTYGTGDFASTWDDGVDELGDDNYCRWCLDGGELFGCMNDKKDGDRCHYSFCKDCITRNYPEDEVLKVSQEDEDEIKWFCYACDETKLAKLVESAKRTIAELTEKDNWKAEKPEANPTKKQKTQHVTEEPNENTNSSPVQNNSTSTPYIDPTKPAQPAIIAKVGTPTQPKSFFKSSNGNTNGSNNKSAKPSILKKVATPTPTITTPSTKTPILSTKKSDATGSSNTPSESTKAPSNPSDKTDPPATPISTRNIDLIQEPITPATQPKPALSKKLDQTVPPITPVTHVKAATTTTKKTDTTPTSLLSQVKSNQTSAKKVDHQEITIIGPEVTVKQNGTPKPTPPSNPLASLKVALPSKPATAQSTERRGSALYQSTSLAKQRELVAGSASNTSRLSTTPLSEEDLKKRLQMLEKTKTECIHEINDRFESLVEMLKLVHGNSDKKQTINSEIDFLRKPIHDIENMVSDMRKIALAL